MKKCSSHCFCSVYNEYSINKGKIYCCQCNMLWHNYIQEFYKSFNEFVVSRKELNDKE